MPQINLSKEKMMKKRTFSNDRLFMNYLSKVMNRHLPENDRSYTASDYFEWAIKTKKSLELSSLVKKDVMNEFLSIRSKRRLNESLLEACFFGNLEKVKEFISMGANVNYFQESSKGVNLYQTVLFDGPTNNNPKILQYMADNFDLNLVKVEKKRNEERVIDLNNRLMLNCSSVSKIMEICSYYKNIDTFKKHLNQYRELRKGIVSDTDFDHLLKVMFIKINLK